MGTAATRPISVDVYLRSSYDPDCEYVDGEVVERIVGQQPHSYAQTRAVVWLDRHASAKFTTYVEQRVRVAANRFRIPDVLLMAVPVPKDAVFAEAPYLCIEILSPDDRQSNLQDKVEDYLGLGVANIWVIDPFNRRAWTVTSAGWHAVSVEADLTTADGFLAMPVKTVLQSD